MKKYSKTVRRSVALPRQLIEEAVHFAPPELRHNLNRLVTLSLYQYLVQQKARAFEEAMVKMAADPAIRSECTAMAEDFACAETDGLKDD